MKTFLPAIMPTRADYDDILIPVASVKLAIPKKGYYVILFDLNGVIKVAIAKKEVFETEIAVHATWLHDEWVMSHKELIEYSAEIPLAWEKYVRPTVK